MPTKHVPHRFLKSMDNSGEQVGGYMSAPVLSMDSQTLVVEAAQFMESHNIGSLLISEGESFVGIMTERDLTRKVLGQGLDPASTKVVSIMSTPLHTLAADRPVEEANKFMAKHGIRHLAVTEEGKIIGMLSVKDLVSYYANPRLRT
ncbi:MAG: CBS domain-containing protein [Candidatus Nitrohelix vancouverensis]|uniref:CBS domain-containing protein n=1 Tax=Candidatus Nitrohelix vancouverensis TaxID=2705534 RepID=A0A7T0C0P6_9BACT|nr:MAG: CBS domain-containing protein [Candidatus Nitrohelix vancouverensis]